MVGDGIPANALQNSVAPSVDFFLENNEKFEEIGKLAIAFELILHEDYKQLRREQKKRWYETLFHLMVQGGRFDQNRLSVITFNYDRSLEAFLFRALGNLYGLDAGRVPSVRQFNSLWAVKSASAKKAFSFTGCTGTNHNSWEGTTLRDTPANRRRVEQDADLISREITAGRFDYGRWFPAGNKMPKAEAPRQGWTVREYYGKWILQQRPPLVRKTLERAYRQHFNRYILPRFGEALISAATLTTRVLLDLQTYLLHDIPRRKKGAKGLAVKTVRNIIDGSYRAMIRDAREIDKMTIDDPFEAIPWPKNKPVKRDPFTREEEDKIIEYFRESTILPFALTMFWTGMRPSECTALRVGDIDLKNGFIIINKLRTLGEENATKTVGSTRAVKLLPHVAAVLRTIKELRVTEDDYFFKNRKRGPIDEDQWRKDYWYTGAAREGYSRARFLLHPAHVHKSGTYRRREHQSDCRAGAARRRR